MEHSVATQHGSLGFMALFELFFFLIFIVRLNLDPIPSKSIRFAVSMFLKFVVNFSIFTI